MLRWSTHIKKLFVTQRIECMKCLSHTSDVTLRTTRRMRCTIHNTAKYCTRAVYSTITSHKNSSCLSLLTQHSLFSFIVQVSYSVVRSCWNIEQYYTSFLYSVQKMPPLYCYLNWYCATFYNTEQLKFHCIESFPRYVNEPEKNHQNQMVVFVLCA